MILIQRAPIRKNGPVGVDVTVKSALGPARCFAPTWDMVMGSKRGQLTWDEYTERYMAILDGVPESAWEWLKAQAHNGVLTVLCYCPDGKNCHTHLLMEYACARFPQQFFMVEENHTEESWDEFPLHSDED